MAGVVVGISRPNEAIVRHLVPFFARDFARFATDAHSRISEETNLNIVLHISVPALIRAVCAFADHDSASGERERLARSIARLAQALGTASCLQIAFRRGAAALPQINRAHSFPSVA